MDAIIDNILEGLLNTLPDARLAVMIIAMLPLVEARLAIPIAIKCGLSPLQGCFYSFLGSSLVIPVLLLLFLPAINLMSKAKPLAKLSSFFLDRFSKKAQNLQSRTSGGSEGGEFKRLFGIYAFTSLPLPLTGVWTGSAIAALLRTNFFKTLLAVILGNLTSCIIVTLLCVFFEGYINTIILILTIIATVTVVFLLLKLIFRKKQKEPAA